MKCGQKLKLICCGVFARMAYKAAAESDNLVDIELMPMSLHIEPKVLNKNLQAAIDRAARYDYDKIILGYGLCGNSVVGLRSKIPLIIPRIHDCCAMFMGSKERFLQVFGHRPSTMWRSSGYMERCPDNSCVNYKLESAVYIEMEGLEYNDTRERFTKQITKDGYKVEVVAGDFGWFERLVNGPWDDAEFLELLPENEIEPIYDMQEVFRMKEEEKVERYYNEDKSG